MEYSSRRMFFEQHWGDLISLYLFHLGVGLLIAATIWHEADLNKVGWSLVVASMGTLRFKGYLNGGSNGQTKTNGDAPSGSTGASAVTSS